MRALVQRVERCSVSVDGSVVGAIGNGMLILLGVGQDDSETDAEYLAGRISALRIFGDAEGKMNFSVQDTGGSVLVVSQFTLYADTRKGNRPSCTDAAAPEPAERLYLHFVRSLGSILGTARVATGEFRAMMKIDLINDGPVTVMIESKP